MKAFLVAHSNLLVAFGLGAIAEFVVGKYVVSPVAKAKAVAGALIDALKASPK